MGMERGKKGTKGKEDGRDTQEKGATEGGMEGGTGDDGGGGRGHPPLASLRRRHSSPPLPFPCIPLRRAFALAFHFKKYFFKFWFDSV